MNQNSLAVVIPVSEWPSRSSGGPRGFTYLLPAALLRGNSEETVVYILHVVSGQLLLIGHPEQLDRLIVSDSDQRMLIGVSKLDKLKNRLNKEVPFEFVKNLISLCGRVRRWWRYRRQVRKLRGILSQLQQKYRSVVCHGHHVETSHVILEASRGLKRTVVIHSEHSKGGLNRELVQLSPGKSQDSQVIAINHYYKDLANGVSRFTFPSMGALRLFQEWNGLLVDGVANNVAVLHSGLDLNGPTDGHSSPDASVLRFFAVAKHVPEKGIDRMIRAVSSLKSRGVSVQLRVAGSETSLTPTLDALREEFGVTTEVTFLGAVGHESILTEMRNCDIFLACPRVVVFDLSLLEAMAMGLSVVTSKLEGNVEALGEDYPGFFSEDSELISVCERLFKNREVLTLTGAANRARYQSQFTEQMMARRYWDLYSDVVTG